MLLLLSVIGRRLVHILELLRAHYMLCVADSDSMRRDCNEICHARKLRLYVRKDVCGQFLARTSYLLHM